MVDLIELARLADCDVRTAATYYSDRRHQMRPRVRARIEKAERLLISMKQRRAVRGSQNPPPRPAA
jgi:hypothetical protein